MAITSVRRGGSRQRRQASAACAIALAGLAAASASATVPTVKVGQDYGLSRAIVVTGTNSAVYRRSGERVGHVLCTGSCLIKWTPVTVPSSTTPLTRGAGVRGALTRFRRPDGRWQVALRGFPLYTYGPDHSPGDARGQGDGGVWFTLTP